MKNAVEIKNLTKKYHGFLLDHVSFTVPSGYICGFIGQNGAGKTTLLKLLLGIARKDDGEIEILGKSADDYLTKEKLGVLFEEPFFRDDWTAMDIEKTLRRFYPSWDSKAYHDYLQRFSLDWKQKFKKMSRGMKMKLGLAASLSHDADLLLYDEPTVGLDPVARDEVLDIMRDYMAREGKTIFFSTHITSDLEKIADYIVYLDKGRIVFSGMKDELVESYSLLRGGSDDLPPEKRGSIIGLREHIGGFEGMIKTADLGGFPAAVIAEPGSLEDIMIHLGRKNSKRNSKS